MSNRKMPGKAGKARPNDLHIVSNSPDGEDLGKCRRQETTRGKLRAKLVTPEVTNETHARYLGLSQEDKAKMKAQPGWIASATFWGPRRKCDAIVDHGLITFVDLDNATPEPLEMLAEGGKTYSSRNYEYQLYTTRSHSPEAPEFRVIMPAKRKTDE